MEGATSRDDSSQLIRGVNGLHFPSGWEQSACPWRSRGGLQFEGGFNVSYRLARVLEVQSLHADSACSLNVL